MVRLDPDLFWVVLHLLNADEERAQRVKRSSVNLQWNWRKAERGIYDSLRYDLESHSIFITILH